MQDTENNETNYSLKVKVNWLFAFVIEHMQLQNN